MVSLSEERKCKIFSNFKNRKIVVVGDLMLDWYLWGSVVRISPEAPVPVVEIESEATRLGGAANVAHNLYTLGAIPISVGIVGNDSRGETIIDLCRKMNFITDGIIKDESRLTTVKTRIIAHNQHVVRADQESKYPISSEISKQLIRKVAEFINDCEAIIFEDYNKGLLTPELIKGIIRLSKNKNKIITADPKYDNFFAYKDVTIFKPNRKETEQVFGIRLVTDQDLENICHEIKQRLSCRNVLITLGEKGMCLLESNSEFTIIPTEAKKVHDVSGAGDTVISTLTLALAAGATLKEATTLANFAAGVVCSEVGVVPIYLDQLIKAIE